MIFEEFEWLHVLELGLLRQMKRILKEPSQRVYNLCGKVEPALKCKVKLVGVIIKEYSVEVHMWKKVFLGKESLLEVWSYNWVLKNIIFGYVKMRQ